MRERIIHLCPFCGNETVQLIEEEGHFAVNCPGNKNYGCGATGGFALTIEKAIYKWNNRNSPMKDSIKTQNRSCKTCKFNSLEDIVEEQICDNCSTYSNYQKSTKNKNT